MYSTTERERETEEESDEEGEGSGSFKPQKRGTDKDLPVQTIRLSSRNASSKYDFKENVWLGDNADHYYILSRFLLSRMLTVAKLMEQRGLWGRECKSIQDDDQDRGWPCAVLWGE